MLSRDYTLQAKEKYIDEQLLYNEKLIYVRYIYVLVLTVTAALTALFNSDPNLGSFLIIGFIAMLINFGLWVNLKFLSQKTNEFVSAFIATQVVVDVVLASLVIFSQGGDQSRATILYALPLISSAVLFSRSLVFIASFLSIIGYVLAVVLNHVIFNQDKLEVLPLIFYPTSFIIVSFVVYFLASSRRGDIAARAYKEVLAMLTHQLRHPLTATLAVADAIKSEKKISKKQLAEYVEMIEKINYDGFNLVNNLLEGASESSGRHIQKVDAAALIADISKVCTVTYKREGDLKFDSSKNEVFIKANPQQLRTALLNIIDNAFKYSDHGESVYVELIEEDKSIQIVVSNPSSQISSAKLTEMSDAFSSAKVPETESDGTGIGLAVSSKIINDMNGRIEFESDDKKAVVRVHLRKV